MNSAWQSVLKFNLTDWRKSPFTGDPIAAFEFLLKTDDDSGKKAAKIELRNYEKDKVAIGVTLTLHNWDNVKEHLENSEVKLYSLSRSNGSLMIARPQEDYVHLYSDENGKIFGLKLRQEIVQKLVVHKEALDFVMKLATDSNGDRIKKLAKFVYGFVLYSLLKKEYQKSCMACNIEMEGEIVDESTPHSCLIGKTGEEVICSQIFISALASPQLDTRFTSMFLALVKHFNISTESATNLKSVYVPILKSSEELRNVVKEAVNGKCEYFFAIDAALQTYRNSITQITLTPKKRKYTSVYEL